MASLWVVCQCVIRVLMTRVTLIATILATTTTLLTIVHLGRMKPDLFRIPLKKDIQLQLTQTTHHSIENARTTGRPTVRSTSKPTITTTPTTNSRSRPKNCDECFKRPYLYMLNSSNVCLMSTTNANQEIGLLMVVTSTVNGYERRQAIRGTWLSVTQKNTHPHIRHVFLFGYTNENEAVKLKKEADVYHDIIQQSFKDSYKNLTLKTLMGLEWAGRFCPTAKYIMKTDDDMFVNVTNVLRLTRQGSNLDKVVFGACHTLAHPIRNIKSKWYASKLSYPEQSYPGFCSGTGYVMSKRVASDIVRVSSSVPFFHLEDVYTAISVRRLGYKLKAVGGFNPYRIILPKSGCGKYSSSALFTSHGVNPSTLLKIWSICGVTVPG